MFKRNVFKPFEDTYVKGAFRELNKALAKDGYPLLVQNLSSNVMDALVTIGRDYHNRENIKEEIDLERPF